MEISYNIPMIAQAVTEISNARTRTEHNREASLALVRSNAEHYVGQGQGAFEAEMATINAKYDQSIQTINAAGAAVAQASETMSQANLSAAAQYT
jgi:uncharacterized protein YukE